jgi:hypothetical protein
MNTLANTNDFLIKYRLRRIIEFWGVGSDDERYTYYMLAPWWAKHK